MARCRLWLIALILGWLLGIPASLAQVAPASKSPLAAGQKISLDLKGVDILDVLKLFSQKSGLNFVAGRNVTGRVTIFVKDVDVWEAFELIVEANGLAYEQRGDIVNVMTDRDYELLYGEKFQERKRSLVVVLKSAKAAQVATALNQIKTNLGRVVVDETSNTLILTDIPTKLEEMKQVLTKLDVPTETRVFNLSYADAEKLKEKTQEFLTPGLGTFSFDVRTNKVIITDTKDALHRIDQLIRAFDEQDGEVLIEAKIMKVDLTDETSLGIDWQRVIGDLDTKSRGSFRVLGDIVEAATPATGVALKFIQSPKPNTQIVFEALQKLGRVETLSNPRITVSNNQEAKILVGTKEAFVTTTVTTPGAGGAVVSSPQVETVDVGTKLFVTPSIKRDNHVQMKIRPEVSSVSRTITSIANTVIPIVSTTEAETTVLVKNGSTLIIGGLIDEKKDVTRSQVPILGDIPVMGHAFRNKLDTAKKSELVVFLTPQIIGGSGERRVEAVMPLTETLIAAPSSEATVPAAYRQLVREQLQRHLAKQFRLASLPAGSVSLSFVLDAQGRLVGSAQITSPGGAAFVQAAKDAFNAAHPFPPFPGQADATEVRFSLAVEHQP